VFHWDYFGRFGHWCLHRQRGEKLNRIVLFIQDCWRWKQSFLNKTVHLKCFFYMMFPCRTSSYYSVLSAYFDRHIFPNTVKKFLLYHTHFLKTVRWFQRLRMTGNIREKQFGKKTKITFNCYFHTIPINIISSSLSRWVIFRWTKPFQTCKDNNEWNTSRGNLFNEQEHLYINFDF